MAVGLGIRTQVLLLAALQLGGDHRRLLQVPLIVCGIYGYTYYMDGIRWDFLLCVLLGSQSKRSILTHSTLACGRTPMAENCIRSPWLLQSSRHKQAGMPRKALVGALNLLCDWHKLLIAHHLRRHPIWYTVGCKSFGQNMKLLQEIACSCQISRTHVNLLHVQLL